jgi:hypothetical protein
MKTPNYDFKKDFPVAKITEMQMAKYLTETQNMKYIDDCDNSDYDILMEFSNGKQVTIEIKEDFTCEKTGNIGVEFESWGRKTGIQISKADFYLYKIHRPDGKKGVYIIPTDNLKEMINNKLYHRIVTGGDPGSYSKNYLFRLDVVKENFKFLGFVEK